MPVLSRRLGAIAMWAASVIVAGGCHEVEPPKNPKNQLEAKDVKTTPKLELVRACTPTGFELCFDAIDNNCNGVIDEGCGLHTGILQFTVAWPEASADIDLHVNGPDGTVAPMDQPTDSGLLKDRDCPGTSNACHGQNVENVYLAEGRPKRGRYRVVVRLENVGEATGPIKVQLSARVGQRIFSSGFELAERQDEHVVEFTL